MALKIEPRPTFLEIFTRFDEEDIAEIIGKDAISILSKLDYKLSRLSNLKKVVLDTYSPLELLGNASFISNVIDVLKEHEAIELCKELNALTLEPYKILQSLNLHKKKYTLQLLKFFNLELEENTITSVKQSNSLSPDCAYPLFTHQRKAIQDIRIIFKEHNKLLLHMPTGSGKTRTSMNFIAEHMRLNEPIVVVWLAHSEELCNQAYEEFKKAWHFLGNRSITISRYYGNSNIDLLENKDSFIVIGLSKFYNLVKKDNYNIGKLANRVQLVIMDEAHMSIAPTYQTVIDVLLTFNSKLLGLSATPGRTWNDIDEDEKLADYFNKKKVTLEIEGYENPVDYLEEKGYIAKVINYPLLVKSGIELTPADNEYLKEYLKLPEKYLVRLSENELRNHRIIQRIEEVISRHKRILVFALSVRHSNLFATILLARGIKAYSLTSNTPSNKRRNLIDHYKSDSEDTIILCNYGILTTGFDAPKTSCAVITRPTDSLVLYSQMVGRAIRGTQAGGNKEAEIVTVIDTNLPGFEKVQDAFFNWENVW